MAIGHHRIDHDLRRAFECVTVGEPQGMALLIAEYVGKALGIADAGGPGHPQVFGDLLCGDALVVVGSLHF